MKPIFTGLKSTTCFSLAHPFPNQNQVGIYDSRRSSSYQELFFCQVEELALLLVQEQTSVDGHAHTKFDG